MPKKVTTSEELVRQIDDWGLREDVRTQLVAVADDIRRRYNLTIPEIRRVIKEILSVAI